MQRLGQAQYISLARAVHRVEHLRRQGNNRGDVDDGAAAGFAKLGGCGRCQTCYRHNIERHQRIGLRSSSVGQGAIHGDTGVIDQYTNALVIA
ncbi:hypothetical protein D3C76_1521690 [compost metagenome]